MLSYWFIVTSHKILLPPALFFFSSLIPFPGTFQGSIWQISKCLRCLRIFRVLSVQHDENISAILFPGQYSYRKDPEPSYFVVSLLLLSQCFKISFLYLMLRKFMAMCLNVSSFSMSLLFSALCILIVNLISSLILENFSILQIFSAPHLFFPSHGRPCYKSLLFYFIYLFFYRLVLSWGLVGEFPDSTGHSESTLEVWRLEV